jgi:cation transport ATPase
MRVAEDIMAKQPWTIIPGTLPGTWSVWLITAMLILFIIGSSCPEGLTVFALTMIAVMVTGISAFITGLLAFLRKKEKALLVLISTAIGMLLIWILIGAIIEDIF